MMPKKFWRKSGKEQAAKCPVCGEYMRKIKVVALVEEGISVYQACTNASLITVWHCVDCDSRGKT